MFSGASWMVSKLWLGREKPERPVIWRQYFVMILVCLHIRIGKSPAANHLQWLACSVQSLSCSQILASPGATSLIKPMNKKWETPNLIYIFLSSGIVPHLPPDCKANQPGHEANSRNDGNNSNDVDGGAGDILQHRGKLPPNICPGCLVIWHGDIFLPVCNGSVHAIFGSHNKYIFFGW